MAKSQLVLEKGIGTASIDGSSIHSPVPAVIVPQTFLTIVCPCGKEHRIDLSNLPQSTSRRMQVHEKCKHAQHFIIHSGHAKYRKILIVSDFGEE
ncbi:MAG: hypothetical protein ACW98F_04750 [Candidatus Hodarchaeales archaeon]|jgi:hypothetical protein